MPRTSGSIPRARSVAADPYAPMAGLYEPLLGALLKNMRRRVAAVALERGWRRVLDLCGGTGGQARVLEGAGLFTAVADLSPAMLAQARTLGATPVLLADAGELPLTPGAFDGAVVSLALHEMEEPLRLRVLQEVARVAPECAIVDHGIPRAATGKVLAALAHVPERLAGADHYNGFRDFMRRGGVRGLADRTGLEMVRSELFFAGAVELALCKMRR